MAANPKEIAQPAATAKQDIIPAGQSLIAKLAHKFAIEPAKLMGTLKATAFRQPADKPEVTNEQMAALLIVADQYGLNPFTKEIYAFPDKNNGIVPVVSIDGWARIVNEHPEFDGVMFEYGPPKGTHFEWMDCVLFRRDRSKPIKVREFWSEVSRTTGPWQSHGNRMHRHKTYIQAARLAFGFAGIYDEDEASRIIERDVTPTPGAAGDPLERAPSRTAEITEKVRRARGESEAIDSTAQHVEEQAPAAPAAPEGARQEATLTLADIEGYIAKAPSREVALEALDLSRQLSSEDQAKANAAFEAKFPAEPTPVASTTKGK